MCCHTLSHQEFHGWRRPNRCFCGCEGHGLARHRSTGKQERISRLQEHLEMLKEEARALEEQIAQIQKEY